MRGIVERVLRTILASMASKEHMGVVDIEHMDPRLAPSRKLKARMFVSQPPYERDVCLVLSSEQACSLLRRARTKWIQNGLVECVVKNMLGMGRCLAKPNVQRNHVLSFCPLAPEDASSFA